MYPLEDTITAIASARGPHGLRGTVRLSGPKSFAALEKLGIVFPARTRESASHFETEIPLSFTDSSRRTVSGRLYCWPNGRSYTGQDAVEVHTLGVLPFLETLVENLCRTGLVRVAQPGEFTLRAFLSGRLDLTQAEAVLGTIDAQDPRKLEAALHQLAGGLAVPLQTLRAELFELLGHLEAGFDFADEDIEFISASEISAGLARSAEAVRGILAKMRSRSASGTLPQAVLYGAPNIGKSALFNALLGKDASLVFDVPGTTRDYLSAELALDGVSCRLVDTAGDFQEAFQIRKETGQFREETADVCPEKQGALDVYSQELARTRRELADIPLLCFDAQELMQTRSSAWRILEERADGGALLLLTRCDLVPEAERAEFLSSLPPSLSRKMLETSTLTGVGLEALRKRLTQILTERAGDESDVVASTQTRCRESLILTLESLERAQLLCGTEFQELIATELRVALEQIGLMVGAVYTEDLLDSIFSRFCVGK
ncbi:MAG: 50S ribosome-binding GTPase [Thermoguttaceae bacterium]|nr:50S ribosome-binding GTPase [Thermoguttaceae bacterium]